MAWIACILVSALFFSLLSYIQCFSCAYKGWFNPTPYGTIITMVKSSETWCVVLGELRFNYSRANFMCQSEFIGGQLVTKRTENIKAVEEFWQKYGYKNETWWAGESLGKCVILTKHAVTGQCYLNETATLQYICEYPPQNYCAWQKKLFPYVEQCTFLFMVTWQWNDFDHAEPCNKTTSVIPQEIPEKFPQAMCDCIEKHGWRWTKWSACKCDDGVGSKLRVAYIPPDCYNGATPTEKRSCNIACPHTTTTITTIATSTSTSTTMPTTSRTTTTTALTTPTTTTTTSTSTIIPTTSRTTTTTGITRTNKTSTTSKTTMKTNTTTPTKTQEASITVGTSSRSSDTSPASTIPGFSVTSTYADGTRGEINKRRNESDAFIHVFIGFFAISLTFIIIGSICLFVGSKQKQRGPLGLMSKKKDTSLVKRKLKQERRKVEPKPTHSPKSSSVMSKNWSISLSTASKKSKKTPKKK